MKGQVWEVVRVRDVRRRRREKGEKIGNCILVLDFDLGLSEMIK